MPPSAMRLKLQSNALPTELLCPTPVLVMTFSHHYGQTHQICFIGFFPFKLNRISHFYRLEHYISNFRGVGWYFSFFPNFNKRFCKQTVKFLIRHRIMRCLIWICPVSLCPQKRTLRLYNLNCGRGQTERWTD